MTKPSYENANFWKCANCDFESDNLIYKCKNCYHPMTAFHIKLLIDENRGIYIPQSFYYHFDFNSWHLNKDDYPSLANPDYEHYWEYWDDLINEAYYIDEYNNKWILYQDSSLFTQLAIEQGE